MFHTPALLKETIHYLNANSGKRFIDATMGGGGHLTALLDTVGDDGKILGIDTDIDAVKEVIAKFQEKVLQKRIIAVHGNFKDITKIAEEYNFKNIDGILFDLGVSSHQLDTHSRGFGFLSHSLDMRMDLNNPLTAQEIINTRSKEELERIFLDYGEEQLAKKIAIKITERRKIQLFEKPSELADVVRALYRKTYHKKSLRNPATKVFQALRIAVNSELENLKTALDQSKNLLRRGGRLVVISYHSLEDRIVKEFLKKESKDCICPPEIPICQCGHRANFKIITKKLVVPVLQELTNNPRSRSAKLRAGEKI